MDGLLVLAGIIIVPAGAIFIAWLSAKMSQAGIPGLVNFGMTLCMMLVFVVLFSSAITYFDSNYDMDTLPFWPDGWLEGH